MGKPPLFKSSIFKSYILSRFTERPPFRFFSFLSGKHVKYTTNETIRRFEERIRYNRNNVFRIATDILLSVEFTLGVNSR